MFHCIILTSGFPKTQVLGGFFGSICEIKSNCIKVFWYISVLAEVNKIYVGNVRLQTILAAGFFFSLKDNSVIFQPKPYLFLNCEGVKLCKLLMHGAGCNNRGKKITFSRLSSKGYCKCLVNKFNLESRLSLTLERSGKQ